MQSGVFRKEITGLNATGVPQYVALAHDVGKLTKQVGNLSDTISKKMDTHYTSLPNDVAKAVLEQCEVTGAVSITMQELTSVIEGFTLSDNPTTSDSYAAIVLIFCLLELASSDPVPRVIVDPVGLFPSR